MRSGGMVFWRLWGSSGASTKRAEQVNVRFRLKAQGTPPDAPVLFSLLLRDAVWLCKVIE